MHDRPATIHLSADAEIVSALLSRQDEVIAELDSLEAQILRVIEAITVERDNASPNILSTAFESSDFGPGEFEAHKAA